MAGEIVLYDYWRSSASYRVRVALESLGIAYRREAVDLLDRSHKSEEHRVRNPQGLVPVLSVDGRMLTQSLAIMEYLAEGYPSAGILPDTALARHRVRALSHAIAMEIHPVCNLAVVDHVATLVGDDIRIPWMARFIGSGLEAIEHLLDDPATGTFCHGDHPTMADFCLAPQLYNAERWQVDTSAFPRILRIAEACRGLPAFQAAHPDRVRPA